MGIFDFLKNIIPSATYTINPQKKPATPTVPNVPINFNPTLPSLPLGNANSTTSMALPSLSPSASPSTSFQTQPIPQVQAPTAASAPTVATTTNRPVVPAVAAPSSMPNAPTTATGAQNSTQGAPSTPAAPAVSPEALKALSDAEKVYQDSLKLTPAELATQEDLDKLIEGTRKAYVNTEDQAIPLEFITGQMASIERRANSLAEPLQSKLARLQAQRTSSLEASKFALDRADKRVASEKSAAADAAADAEKTRQFNVQQDLAAKKFQEDTRQFGLTYAQNERKLQQDAALAREKLAADKTPAGNVASEALGNYQLTNDLLNLDPSSITGVGQNPLNFLGITNQEAINKYDQLKGILALDNRQKLKGSGAISDFESRTLQSAASALGRNLPNDAFTRELKKVRGVFANAAGLEANVKITDPKTGVAKEGTLSRDDINSAISQGYNVEYQ